MELAMIGLGKMGANMATRLLHGGHRIVAFDLNEAAIQAAEAEGAKGARTLGRSRGQAVGAAGRLGYGAIGRPNRANRQKPGRGAIAGR